jgi:CRISPR/Cas system-associated endoribonuclease Cas2
MNRGNRKTFVARLGKNKLENIQSNAKKFMNNKKKPNVKPVVIEKKPEEPKVNKFANQKTLSKYLQNMGMNRGNRKTFVARLGKNKLENIQSNAKKFMNNKKKPNVKPVVNEKKPEEPKVNKFANQKTLSKYLQNIGMNRGNRKTFVARLGKNKLENIQSNAKKFMNKPKELSNNDKGVRWKLFNSPKYNKLTTQEREDLFKRWMNKKNKTIWANAQKIQASRTKNSASAGTENLAKEVQKLISSPEIPFLVKGRWTRNAGRVKNNPTELTKIKNDLRNRLTLSRQIASSRNLNASQKAQLRKDAVSAGFNKALVQKKFKNALLSKKLSPAPVVNVKKTQTLSDANKRADLAKKLSTAANASKKADLANAKKRADLAKKLRVAANLKKKQNANRLARIAKASAPRVAPRTKKGKAKNRARPKIVTKKRR